MNECDLSRERFKDLGLGYQQIKPIHIRKLCSLIESELIDYYETGGDHAQSMCLRISPLRKKHINIERSLHTAEVGQAHV